MKQDIETFIKLLHELQKIDPEFPLQYARCLFEIALDEGLCLTDLSERTGTALSTISRVTSALAKEKARGKNYALVQIKISSKERRRKQLFLTKKGRDVISNVSALLAEK